MKTIETHIGDVIKDSLIILGRINCVRDGYIRTSPCIRTAIAINVNGGWEALYECGGDWNGISGDDFDDIFTLGSMDDLILSDGDQLLEGASELELWADQIKNIATDNEALQTLVDYMNNRAYSARKKARKLTGDKK